MLRCDNPFHHSKTGISFAFKLNYNYWWLGWKPIITKKGKRKKKKEKKTTLNDQLVSQTAVPLYKVQLLQLLHQIQCLIRLS